MCSRNTCRPDTNLKSWAERDRSESIRITSILWWARPLCIRTRHLDEVDSGRHPLGTIFQKSSITPTAGICLKQTLKQHMDSTLRNKTELHCPLTEVAAEGIVITTKLGVPSNHTWRISGGE